MPPPPTECCICFTSTSDLYDGFAECPSCSSLFCGGCYQMYLQLKISSGLVLPTQLVCPGADCTAAISPDRLELYIDDSLTLALYTSLVAHQTHSATGGIFCPRPDCGAPIPHGLKRKILFKRRVDCPTCARQSCLRCGDDYHRRAGPTCSNKAHAAWYTNTHSKPCPNCHFAIEKAGGCNHVTCTNCRHEFDWATGWNWGLVNGVQVSAILLVGVPTLVAWQVVVAAAVAVPGLPVLAGYKVLRACQRKPDPRPLGLLYRQLIHTLHDDFLFVLDARVEA